MFYRTAVETGGITASTINSNLFKVTNSGIDSYNILSPSQAAGNSIAVSYTHLTLPTTG